MKQDIVSLRDKLIAALKQADASNPWAASYVGDAVRTREEWQLILDGLDLLLKVQRAGHEGRTRRSL